MLVLYSSSFLIAQTHEQISSLVLPAIDIGIISSTEAEEIRQYLVEFGLPIVKEEAWSVPGLSNQAASWLAESEMWLAWTIIERTESRSSIRTQGYFVHNENDENLTDLRIRSSRWGVRVINSDDEKFISGFVKGRRDRFSWTVGDYHLHWGTGLTVVRYDPYSSLRSSHTLGAKSRPFEAVMPSKHIDFQRGAVISISEGKWWNSTALHFAMEDGVINPEIKSCLFYSHPMIKGLITAGLIQNFNLGYGGVFRAELDNIGCEVEVLKTEIGSEYLFRAVVSSNRGTYAYLTCGSNETNVLGIRLGSSTNSLDIESNYEDSEASLEIRSNYLWELWEDADIQARLRIKKIFNNPSLIGMRFRCEIGEKPYGMRATLEFQKLIGDKGMSCGIRVDVLKSRRLSVAVLHGSGQSRLYQLLSTARGYRLFSVSDNEDKLILCWDLLPGRIKVSWEKVLSEGTETNRFAIYLTHGKYIRH
jgi:hypothetical protein